jgi:hypothetical protein
MPNNTDRRQAIPNLERKLVKVQIRIEKVAFVLAPRFKLKLLPPRLVEEVLLARSRGGGYAVFAAYILTVTFRALLVYHRFALLLFFRVWCCLGVALSADFQHVYRGK